jgi:hypothetical protein
VAFWRPSSAIKPLALCRLGRGEKKKVYDQALANFRRGGAPLTPVAFDENLPPIGFLLEAEDAAAFEDIAREGDVRILEVQTASSQPNTFQSSRFIPAMGYIRAQRTRTQVIARFEKFVARWDVIVMQPPALLTAANLAGNPQVVTKCGFVKDTPWDG